MSRKPYMALALLMLATGCSRQDENAPPKAEDFALSLNVEADGAQVRRVDLPAAALVAIRRADRGDIRVMDAHGRPLSMAFIAADAGSENKVRLNAIPFDRLTGRNPSSPVSVRVERNGSSVSVESGQGETGESVAGVLFDTRTIKEPVIGIALEAEMPKQRPIAVSIAAGEDLASWESLAEHMLFRPGDGPELLGGSRIRLPGADLHHRYIYASWPEESGLRIEAATLFTSSAPPRPRVSISATGLKLADAHRLSFNLPPGAMPAALRVTMTGKDGVLPIRLLGRDTREAPWIPLAMTSLRQGSAGALLEIGERPLPMLKLEADPRSAGFSQAPKVELQYAPVALAVAFNGDGPYRLLVGNSNAKPATFALHDLTNPSGPLAEAKIIGARPDVSVEVAESGHDAGPAPRVIALWSVLLAGVALLAYAALRLMRANSSA